MRALYLPRLCIALIFVSISLLPAQERASAGSPRTVKTQVAPVYPEITRKMNVTGTVQLEAVVRADGTVKEVHVLGGHPLLADAASRAVLQWRYQRSERESTELVRINFGN